MFSQPQRDLLHLSYSLYYRIFQHKVQHKLGTLTVLENLFFFSSWVFRPFFGYLHHLHDSTASIIGREQRLCTTAACTRQQWPRVRQLQRTYEGHGLKRAHNEVEKASSVWIRPEGTWLIHQAHTLYCSCDCSEENMLALLTRCAIIFINSCQESTFCTGTSQVCYCTQLMEYLDRREG